MRADETGSPGDQDVLAHGGWTLERSAGKSGDLNLSYLPGWKKPRSAAGNRPPNPTAPEIRKGIRRVSAKIGASLRVRLHVCLSWMRSMPHRSTDRSPRRFALDSFSLASSPGGRRPALAPGCRRPRRRAAASALPSTRESDYYLADPWPASCTSPTRGASSTRRSTRTRTSCSRPTTSASAKPRHLGGQAAGAPTGSWSAAIATDGVVLNAESFANRLEALLAAGDPRRPSRFERRLGCSGPFQYRRFYRRQAGLEPDLLVVRLHGQRLPRQLPRAGAGPRTPPRPG